jgi:hypothetical protein
MRHPFAGGNAVDWSQCVHHHTYFQREQTVAEVYGKMLTEGIDFAGAFDKEGGLCGLISFRMLSSALSARYGQALFADKALGQTSVPKVIFGPVADLTADELIPLVIPLEKVVLSSRRSISLQRKSCSSAARRSGVTTTSSLRPRPENTLASSP